MADWDFKESNVEWTDFDPDAIVSAESTLIAAGPPTQTAALAALGGDAAENAIFDVFPIGLVENFGVTMGNQLQRIFEIGSAKSLIIPGRLIGTATVARIIYDSRTLLRALYAIYNVTLSDETTDNITDYSVKKTDVTLKSDPGRNEFWLNLDSDMFRYPFGMALLFRTKNNVNVGGVYLENCYIGGTQLTINAGTDILAEGANLQFTEMKPIVVKATEEA